MGIFNELVSGVANYLEEENAKELAKQIEHKNKSDKDDFLKTLMFFVCHKTEISRDHKKFVADSLSTYLGEKISLFSIEDQVEEIYNSLSKQTPEGFLNSIKAISDDREVIKYIFISCIQIYLMLIHSQKIQPTQIYNFYLIKKIFNLNRQELAECYDKIGDSLGISTDEVAEIIEEATSESTINAMKQEFSDVEFENEVEIDNNKDACDAENESVNSSENQKDNRSPREIIEESYYKALKNSKDDSESFGKKVGLAYVKTDMVNKAVKAYAKQAQNETPIIVTDDTVFGNCKNGMLITNKNVYICNMMEKPVSIPIETIRFIDCTTKWTNMGVNINEVVVQTSQLSANGTKALCEFLKEIIHVCPEFQ